MKEECGFTGSFIHSWYVVTCEASYGTRRIDDVDTASGSLIGDKFNVEIFLPVPSLINILSGLGRMELRIRVEKGSESDLGNVTLARISSLTSCLFYFPPLNSTCTHKS